MHLGAAKSEQTEQRCSYRNGSRKVTVKASTLGKIELSVPRDRDGTFHPRLLEKCSGPNQALLLGVMEGFLLGLLTRKVAAAVNQLGLGALSKSQVSRMRMRMGWPALQVPQPAVARREL